MLIRSLAASRIWVMPLPAIDPVTSSTMASSMPMVVRRALALARTGSVRQFAPARLRKLVVTCPVAVMDSVWLLAAGVT